MSTCQSFRCLASFVLLIAVAGCGESLTVAEVEGIVTLDGKPLDKIQVEFWPVAEGRRSFGTTDAEGRYKLTTDDGKLNGATIGDHKVVLHDVGILGDKFLGCAGETVDMSQGRKSRISGNYANPEITKITKEVVAGKKNDIPIEVVK